MRKYLVITIIVTVGLMSGSQLFAKHWRSVSRLPHLFAEESEESEEGPTEAVIKKLGAMSPDQKFERGEEIKSDGKHAPKDTPVYPVDIKNAEGKSVLKLFFFKGENGKWSVYDEAGNVMHET
jgi:hypothetical protein